MKTALKYSSGVLLLLFFFTCEKEITNPFDPDCPKEIWTPSGFQAVQADDNLVLTWKQENMNITGFKIERKVGTEDWSNVASPGKTAISWSDSDLKGGEVHLYRLYAYAGDNISNTVTAEATPVLAASLTTAEPTHLTCSSVTLGGNISTTGGANITERGIVYAKTANPTTSDTKIAMGSGQGAFAQEVTGLEEKTTYYVRAYAINSAGTSYGNQVSFTTPQCATYVPVYEGEIFYMPFDGNFMELISFQPATEVGNPDFAGVSVEGENAYAGATNSYLTFPAEELQTMQFSAVFWMRINAIPDRAGILVMSPEDPANPNAQNIRTSGFRFFREGSATRQLFKLNVGTGDDEAWFDGGDAATIDPTATDWVHLAFTIAADQAKVYINGNVVSQGELAGIDWTGVDQLSIMSGAPGFTGWNHLSDLSYMDELRLFNRVLTQNEIQGIIERESGKIPQFEGRYGEIFYLPFEGNFIEHVTGEDAMVIGSPGFDYGISGQAYAGAEGAYLSFPTRRLQNDVFSATFWMYINTEPSRAGILVMSQKDTENVGYPERQNDRTKGLRFFREDDSGMQRFKLNVGTDEGERWFDGGANANVDPSASNWVHFAITISESRAAVYIDGEEVSSGEHAGINWLGADLLSIMSGAPRFTEWNHFSDQSLMDELRIYDRMLTQEEIHTMINDAYQ